MTLGSGQSRRDDLITERKLTQARIAETLGISRPMYPNCKTSNWVASRRSVLQFMTHLDKGVEIIIRPRAADHPTGRVSV
jgi:predicted XRE-type DNA-binding protein